MTANIGYATLSVIPSMKGAFTNLQSELGAPLEAASDAAGTSSAKSFGGKFSDGLKKFAGPITATALFGGAMKLAGSFDEASDKIRTTTGATGDALKGLEGSFKNVVSTVPADFGDAGTAIADLNQKLGLSGKPLEALSTQILNLSHVTGTDLQANVTAASGLFNSWGTAAADQGPKLDELFRISQLTGVSVADLSTGMTEGGVQFRQAGLSFEQSGALLGTLGKAGLAAGDVMPALSKAMATAAKDGKPAAQVFQETFDAIKNAPDGTAAAGIAMDVFGAKAGPKFAALIREGKLSYEDMATSIAGGGDTINAAAKDTEDWQEKLKLLMNKGMVALEPIATKVFGAVSTAIELIAPVLTGVWDVFKSVFSWLGDHQPILIGIVAVIGVGLVTALGFWLAATIPLVVALAAQAVAFLAAYAPIIAAGIALAALVAGVVWAVENFDLFVDAAKAVYNFVKDNVITIFQTLISIAILPVKLEFLAIKALIFDVLIPAFQAVWDFITNKVITIFKAIGTAIGDAASAVGTAVDTVVGFVTGIPGRIASVVSGLWNGIKTGITEAKDWVSGKIDAVVGFATGLPGRIANVFSGMWDGIKNAFKAALNWVIGKWNSLHFKLPSLDLGPFGSIGGWTVGVPQIPLFDQGGFMPGAAGSHGLAILQAGEQVLTASQQNGGGGLSVGDRLILEIEGTPFQAIVKANNRELAASFNAGRR